ncbi:MAG: hypothetical protein Fues2KO_47070 [Fuerstiella sp.]
MSEDQRATLTRLQAMRDSGVTESTVDGVTTKFQSVSELNRAITRLERKLGLRTPRYAKSVFMGHR